MVGSNSEATTQLDNGSPTMVIKERDDLLFVARMSVNYHEASEAFYSGFVMWSAALSLLFSSTAVAGLGDTLLPTLPVAKDAIFAVYALLVTIMNTAVLAFRFPGKVQLHSGFKRKWLELERDLVCLHDLDLSESKAALVELTKRAYQLHGEEPPVSKNRVRRAYNSAVESLGRELSYKVGFFDFRKRFSSA